VPDAPGSSAGGRPLKPIRVEGRDLKPKTLGGGLRKAPLGVPKRAIAARPQRRSVPPSPPAEPSSAARDLALALAAAAIDKKAIGIEILDVTGKVDYADFLVVMTGRGGRHVHAIATGIEEAMRKRKLSPISMEGLAGATWVLIDFGDVVVHVFQEDARAIYDIEGLWIDAGRVPVPDADKTEGSGARPPVDG
jgi:ribosome-associated protein